MILASTWHSKPTGVALAAEHGPRGSNPLLEKSASFRQWHTHVVDGTGALSSGSTPTAHVGQRCSASKRSLELRSRAVKYQEKLSWTAYWRTSDVLCTVRRSIVWPGQALSQRAWHFFPFFFCGGFFFFAGIHFFCAHVWASLFSFSYRMTSMN